MDAATIKGVVDRLGKRGLVATAPDPGDARRMQVSITPEGLRTVARGVKPAAAITAETLKPLACRASSASCSISSAGSPERATPIGARWFCYDHLVNTRPPRERLRKNQEEDMTDSKLIVPQKKRISRRSALKLAGAGAAATMMGPGFVRYAQAQSSEPIRIGFQVHRTGIGAAYGRWYERTTTAAVKLINEQGGINGRQVEIIAEDDGTDPGRGAEVVEKFATQHKCDVAFGTLFSHVVMGSAPRAGELKLPYYVVSEGHHVASGAFNRYTFQPGITDVKSQVISHGAVDRQERRQEGHHDLPGLRLRL